MGIGSGDAVMVHASLRSAGPVVGGPDTVISALRDAVGPGGTILAYADWQGQEAIDDGEPRVDVPPFDPLASRASRDNGAFPELLRTTPGALRSGNPGASIVALGARAAWFTAGHALNYGYGPGSPLARLVEARGKVLMLGAPLDTMTLLHHAEHLARIPHRVKRYEAPLLIDGVASWQAFEEYDTSDPPGDLADDYMAALVEDYLAQPKGRRGLIANASSVCVEAGDIVPFAVKWLEQRLSR